MPYAMHTAASGSPGSQSLRARAPSVSAATTEQALSHDDGQLLDSPDVIAHGAAMAHRPAQHMTPGKQARQCVFLNQHASLPYVLAKALVARAPCTPFEAGIASTAVTSMHIRIAEQHAGRRDGESHNLSWNCGIEGPTQDASIQRLRARQMRNLSMALLLAQGIPMVLMGDEYGHSKVGWLAASSLHSLKDGKISLLYPVFFMIACHMDTCKQLQA